MGKRLLIAVIVLLLAPIALLATLLYTPWGLQLIAQQLPRLERYGVYIQGVSGTLSGPLHVERFELQHPRVHIVSHDIVADPQLRGLLLQTVRAASVSARDTIVEIRAADLPPSNKPPRFLPSFMRVDVRSVTLQKVRYVHLNGATIDADHVRGRVTITSRRLRVREFDVTAPQFEAAGDLRLAAGEPLSMHGRATGRLRLPRAQLGIDAAVSGPIDRLAIEGVLREPQRATLDALYTRREEGWRLAGEVRSHAFELDAFLDRPAVSLREVALQFVADPEEIRAAGQVGVQEQGSEERAWDVALDARGRYADRLLQITSADLALKGAPSRVHASGSIAFAGAAPELDVAARWTSLQWPLTGAALVVSERGSGTLRGAMPYEFTVDAQVEGSALPMMRGEARGRLSREQLRVDGYRIDALDGVLRGAGTLRWGTPHAWDLSVSATDVDPAILHSELPGRLSFAAQGSGSGWDRRADFDVRVEHLSGVLRAQRVAGSGAVRRNRKDWTVAGLDLRFGSATLALEGSWGELVDLRWNLHAPSLAQILPQALGSLESSGAISGLRASPRISAVARGGKLRYGEWSADSLYIDADVDASNERPSRLLVQGAGIGRNAAALGELRIEGEGRAENHRLDVALTGVAPGPRGAPARASLQIAGVYREEQWNATIESARLTRAGREEHPLELAEPAALLVSVRDAQLESLCLNVGAGRICAEGAWRRDGAWNAVLAGYEIPLALVLPPSGEQAEFAGRIEGRIRVNGAPGQLWQGDAGMRIIDAAIIHRPPGVEAQRLDLGAGGLGAKATPERIDFSFGVQAFADTFLYANAQIQREPGVALTDAPLTGDIRARASDANMLPLVFREIDHAAGVLSANATLGGALGKPEINGRIELSNGEFDSYRVNLALRELNLAADLAGNALSFRGDGRAGEGRLAVDGRFAWNGGISRGEMRLRGDSLLLADLPEYRVVASPDLRFQIEGEQMRVAGDVTIPSASVQPDRLTGAVRASPDARYVDEHPAERTGRFAVQSEIRVRMGEDVRVNAFGLEGRITGAVLVTARTDDTPMGRGELSVIEGRYRAYGQNLEISRGQLLFDASPLDDPGLDIEARRRIDTTTVGLNVRGTLQEPRLTLFSDPSMPQSQILAWLLTGKSNDAVRASDADAIGAARDTLALQGGGLLASQIGRRIGLDEVGVESSVDTAGEANSALVLGKFLSPRLFISYGISLTESINTLKLRYTISDRWVLRTEAGERQSADLEFTIER
ncbi:MAG TPA: translocation/assembly module TamB domain-containing protein [Steroidobacter sp.]|nr:translocation/assembly module TamB domain-containing protein [Steroidobacter sp.]